MTTNLQVIIKKRLSHLSHCRGSSEVALKRSRWAKKKKEKVLNLVLTVCRSVALIVLILPSALFSGAICHFSTVMAGITIAAEDVAGMTFHLNFSGVAASVFFLFFFFFLLITPGGQVAFGISVAEGSLLLKMAFDHMDGALPSCLSVSVWMCEEARDLPCTWWGAALWKEPLVHNELRRVSKLYKLMISHSHTYLIHILDRNTLWDASAPLLRRRQLISSFMSHFWFMLDKISAN